MLQLLKYFSFILYAVVITLTFLVIVLFRHYDKVRNKKVKTIGFFHPYANDGGGGERVLWCALKALQIKFPDHEYIVYTGDKVSPENYIKNVNKNFGIDLNSKHIRFVILKYRAFIQAKYYPIFTLLGQTIGSMLLGLEALYKFAPDIFIDTAGYAFVLPFFKYFGSKYVGCYVHYPTISTDMIDLVKRREAKFNNKEYLAQYKCLSQCKLYYYNLFAKLYKMVGKASDFVFVNSTWTKNHIIKLWEITKITYVLYPPCDTKIFGQILNKSEDILKTEVFALVSIGQFRPEKNHSKQILIFKMLLEKLANNLNLKQYHPKLILVGSCRNHEDEGRITILRKLCEDLKISNHVEFKLNISFNEIKELMATSMIGLHTMKDEHFGIGIVECMAAGVVMIANNSGGPKLDILQPYKGKPVGFLADSDADYCDKILQIIQMSPNQREDLRTNAREAVSSKFSTEMFNKQFVDVLTPFIEPRIVKKQD